MNKLDNIVITMSGEPASGKSTVVGILEQKYKEMGYTVETINAGHIFRKMVVAKYLEMHPEKNKENINISDVQNDPEFSQVIRQEIDTKLDEGIAEYVKFIQKKATENQVIIVDSRLAWKNIPNSYSVRLTVAEEIAGRRVFEDRTRGKEDKYSTLEEAIEKTKQRKLGEIARYKQRYGVDLTNPNNYQCIIDSAFANPQNIADVIIDGEQANREGKYYPKTWASPAHFLPTQDVARMDAGREFENTIDGIAEKMQKNGYNAELGEIWAGEKDGVKYVIDGHHRVLSALKTGKSVIPYSEIPIRHFYNDINNYYDWTDGIRYYGGKKGQIKHLENFELLDIININNDSLYRKMKGLPPLEEATLHDEDER